MPMQASGDFGSEADGSPSADYCVYCYKEGAFTHPGTMEQMIDHCAQFHEAMHHEDGSPFTREEAIAMMRAFFPALKRWKK